jgi:beta-lactamase regulating signal transducer with metallopeptidase domain
MDAALGYLGNALIGGTVLAAATALIVRLPAVRRRPALACALWLIVLVRFLVPGVVPVEVPIEATAAEAPAAGAALAGEPSAAAVASGSGPSLLATLMALWIAGAGLAGFLSVAAAIRLRRRIAGFPAAPAAVARLAAAVAADLGLRRVPAIRIAPPGARSAGPFACGVFRPLVVLPSWLVGADSLTDVLYHELAHVRRRDPAWALIQRAAVAMFFFWPVVWWASRELSKARERACDLAAVDRGGRSPARYAATLIEVSLRARGARPALAAMAAERSQLAGRVEAMLSGERARGVGALGAVALLAVIALALPRGAATAAGDVDGPVDCTVAPGVEARILASHPDADTNGDGVLSRDEICAHQIRMQRRLIDETISSELLATVDLAGADRDGDGAVSADELAAYKEDVEMSFTAAAESSPSLVRDGELLVSLPVELEIVDAGTAICTLQSKCGEHGESPAPRSSLVLIRGRS